MTIKATNLTDLLAELRAITVDRNEQDIEHVLFYGHGIDIVDLPTFGGPDIVDTPGIWSWDETHQLVGEGPFRDWQIEPRDH